MNNSMIQYEVEHNDNERWIIRDKNSKYEINLNKRLLDFAVEVIRFLKTLPDDKIYDVVKYQLSKSATSIGANYEESQAGTYKEFANKIQICLREAKESMYWFKIIDRLEIGNREDIKRLLKENYELCLIFGSISSKTKLK